MDDVIEIDLKKYFQVLFERWKWIVGSAVLVALLALGISSLQPLNYESSALIAVTQPRTQLNFDPKYQTLYTTQPNNKAYLDLAASDDVLSQVLQQWPNRPDAIRDVSDFRKTVVKVESGSDVSIIKLSVTVGDPALAARLANLWATTFVTKANAVYFGQGQQLQFLQIQLNSAQQDLQSAEKALVDFQGKNQLYGFTNQLNSALQAQNEYLAVQRNITYVQQSLSGLRAQISAAPNARPNLSDQLNALLLQIRVYNSQVLSQPASQTLSNDGAANTQTTPLSAWSSTVSALPLQIQVTDLKSLGSLSAAEQLAVLDALSQNLDDQNTQINELLKALSEQILKLQQTVETYRVQQDQLLRTRDVARSTYTTLAQKVDETRISEQDPTDRLQVASNAMPPERAISRNRVRNTLLGGVVGGLLGVVGILLAEWWRGNQMPEAW